MAFNTISGVLSELPGTPAPANAATVDISTIVSIIAPPTGTPYKCAMNTAATALYAADPFLLSDAPGGRTKLTMSFGIPRRSRAAAMLTGSVAFDDAVENATRSASDTDLKNAMIRTRAPST